jgi:hypothetical protein
MPASPTNPSTAETPYAPSISTFEATIRSFLKASHVIYINRLYDELKGQEKNFRKTKKSLWNSIPSPTLFIVPFPNIEEMSAYVDRFEKLQRLDVVVIKRNKEISASELMESVNSYRDKLKGGQTKVSTTQPAGLDHAGAKQVLKEIGAAGTDKITLVGEDKSGNKLVAKNEDFSVKTVIDHLPNGTDARAKGLYAKFLELVRKNLVPREKVTEDVKSKVRAAVESSVWK